MFFSSWAGPGRVLIVGVLAYIGLIVLLRLSGKRTLAKMNAFDFVVTVALGSTLATVLLSKDVALMEGLVAFATLIALQFVIAWLSVRSRMISGFVKFEPSLLLYRGHFLRETLRRERVTEGEVRSAARQGGYGDLTAIEAIILETDGTFSVIASGNDASPTATALSGVQGFADRRRQERGDTAVADAPRPGAAGACSRGLYRKRR